MIRPDGDIQETKGDHTSTSRKLERFLQNCAFLLKTFKQKCSESVSAKKKTAKNRFPIFKITKMYLRENLMKVAPSLREGSLRSGKMLT